MIAYVDLSFSLYIDNMYMGLARNFKVAMQGSICRVLGRFILTLLSETLFVAASYYNYRWIIHSRLICVDISTVNYKIF